MPGGVWNQDRTGSRRDPSPGTGSTSANTTPATSSCSHHPVPRGSRFPCILWNAGVTHMAIIKWKNSRANMEKFPETSRVSPRSSTKKRPKGYFGGSVHGCHSLLLSHRSIESTELCPWHVKFWWYSPFSSCLKHTLIPVIDRRCRWHSKH